MALHPDPYTANAFLEGHLAQGGLLYPPLSVNLKPYSPCMG